MLPCSSQHSKHSALAPVHRDPHTVPGRKRQSITQGQGIHAGAQAEGELAEDVVQRNFGLLQAETLAWAAPWSTACKHVYWLLSTLGLN